MWGEWSQKQKNKYYSTYIKFKNRQNLCVVTEVQKRLCRGGVLTFYTDAKSLCKEFMFCVVVTQI